MQEQQQVDKHKEQPEKKQNTVLQWECAIGVALLGLLIDMVINGPGGAFGRPGGGLLVIFGVLSAIAYEIGPDILARYQRIRQEGISFLPGEASSYMEKAPGKTRVLAPPTNDIEEEAVAPRRRVMAEPMPELPQKSPTTTTMKFDDEAGQDLIAYSHAKKTTVLDQPSQAGAPGLFSQVLHGFAPSLDRIYLAVLENGQLVSVEAPKLCHTAVAGATSEGKSSILRMLMLQLCYINASILLLNPHYTRYDLEAKEDWTPYEPYLLHDPMESRKYEVIEYYLKQVATELLPTRMEKYAHSQPLGKPYFIVIDELPAIVKKIPDAPGYLEDILREGRKVGIFLITASQDFLVKTISPEGGGAVRDCYRTAYYVGGDATTAKKLLDIPSNQIPEHLLGKGTVMLRAASCKQASLAYVPYVDNQALYSMLGPSTYVPGRQQYKDTGDDQYLETIAQGYSQQPRVVYTPPAQSGIPTATVTSTRAPKVGTTTRKLSPGLQATLDVYTPGMSHRTLAHLLTEREIEVSHVTAGNYIQRLKDLRIIDSNGNRLLTR